MDNYKLNLETEATRNTDAMAAVLMRNVYVWMFLAVLISALSAVVAVETPLRYLLFIQTATGGLAPNSIVAIGLAIALLGCGFAFIFLMHRLPFIIDTLLFIVYSVLFGFSASSLIYMYTSSSLVSTFLIAAVMFAAMAIIGSFTKKDLSFIGKFAIMTLIGLIIAGIVAIFIPGIITIVSVIGVITFAALTAYDAQKIKKMLYAADGENQESLQKLALYGAFEMYLDFVNLFMYLIRLFGRRK